MKNRGRKMQGAQKFQQDPNQALQHIRLPQGLNWNIEMAELKKMDKGTRK